MYWCVQTSVDAIGGWRRHWVPWNWSHRWLKTAPHGCQEPKSGPPQEQQALLTAEPSLQSPLITSVMMNDMDAALVFTGTERKVVASNRHVNRGEIPV